MSVLIQPLAATRNKPLIFYVQIIQNSVFLIPTTFSRSRSILVH